MVKRSNVSQRFSMPTRSARMTRVQLSYHSMPQTASSMTISAPPWRRPGACRDRAGGSSRRGSCRARGSCRTLCWCLSRWCGSGDHVEERIVDPRLPGLDRQLQVALRGELAEGGVGLAVMLILKPIFSSSRWIHTAASSCGCQPMRTARSSVIGVCTPLPSSAPWPSRGRTCRARGCRRGPASAPARRLHPQP